jgi:hypothetical protein
MHRRPEIRSSIITLLKGQTAAADNVLDSVFLNIEQDKLPAITVKTGDEDVEHICDFPREEKRTLPIVIQLYLKEQTSGTDVQSQLDAMASKVEAILNGNKLEGLCEGLDLTKSEQVTKATGQVFGSLIMNYQTFYYV